MKKKTRKKIWIWDNRVKLLCDGCNQKRKSFHCIVVIKDYAESFNKLVYFCEDCFKLYEALDLVVENE